MLHSVSACESVAILHRNIKTEIRFRRHTISINKVYLAQACAASRRRVEHGQGRERRWDTRPGRARAKFSTTAAGTAAAKKIPLAKELAASAASGSYNGYCQNTLASQN